MDEATVDISDSRSSHLAVSLCWEPADLTRVYKIKKTLWKIILRFKLHKNFVVADTFHGDTDLDLSCYIFDAEGRYIRCVSGDSLELMDPSGAVNHTGNNRDGYGNIDEGISLKLPDMPVEYKQFIFVVTSPHGRRFKDVRDGEVRIENRSAHKIIYSKKLGQQDGVSQFAYIACGVFNQSQGWHIQEMNNYARLDENWPVYLRRYLLDRP